MEPLAYLVDDEPLVTRALQRNLRKHGYRVLSFHDGHDLLEAVATEAPAAVITDIEMPLMSGRELCETIASQYPQREFPIFVVTGATDLVHRQWSSEIHNLQFVEKPVSMHHLLDLLSASLANTSLTGEQA